MNSELKNLEDKLEQLRPSNLPSPVRRDILSEIERKAQGHGRTFWLFSHRAGFQVALASAVSLALLMSSHWLSSVQRPSTPTNQTMFATSNAHSPSLAFLDANFAAISQIGINAVPVPRSASMLTNTQIQR